MKNLCMLLVSLFTIQGFSQVGIGTTTPEGALDVSSTQFGYVLPRIALTATNTAAPVVNPKQITMYWPREQWFTILIQLLALMA